MLKTLKTIPPGGWIYVQEYNDNGQKRTRKFSDMGPIGTIVGVLLSFRTANKLPRASYDEIVEDIENATCERIGFDPQWCVSKKNWTALSRPGLRESVVAGAIHAVRNAASGASILSDWCGEGAEPVDNALANARAQTCLVCPRNQEGHFFAKLTGLVARAILAQRRVKTERGLQVSCEDALHTCTVCDCHLPLKVWVPWKTIFDRTHPDKLKEFPEQCWILTETKTTSPAP
jgi:hypothetical protein